MDTKATIVINRSTPLQLLEPASTVYVTSDESQVSSDNSAMQQPPAANLSPFQMTLL